MKRASRGLARIGVQAEELPDADNRVVLADRKDEIGFRSRAWSTASTGIRWRSSTTSARRRSHHEGDARQGNLDQPQPGARHFLGGTVMARARRTRSPTATAGRTTSANLFITGGGLFPTIAEWHPTFTLHALTLRHRGLHGEELGAIAA